MTKLRVKDFICCSTCGMPTTRPKRKIGGKRPQSCSYCAGLRPEERAELRARREKGLVR